jgi:nucleotide sugar dehydrogenase
MSQKVAVIGLGYVGLPLACLCAEKDFEISGLELDEKKIFLIRQGKSPIKDHFVEEKLPRLHEKIFVTNKPREALQNSGVIIIAVPTPMSKNKPDLSALKSALVSVEANLEYCQKKPLVIIESTVYPGTTVEVAKPILERNSLKAGIDFELGHCPERVDPGNKKFGIGNIPRVVCCTTREGSLRAKEFYSKIVDAEITVLDSIIAVEAVKVFENTFRDINIAYVNDLAKGFDRMGIDIKEVIRGASTKPFGFMPFYPGPGVGGHCIPKDPCYLIASSKKAGFTPKLLELARKINRSMPAYVVELVENSLKQKKLHLKSQKICVLGVAFKPEIDDIRESPAWPIISMLKEKKAALNIFDPFVPGASTAKSIEDAVSGCSCIVLCTQHMQFLEKITPEFLKSMGVRVVIDARNCLDKKGIIEKGILYKGIGS